MLAAIVVVVYSLSFSFCHRFFINFFLCCGAVRCFFFFFFNSWNVFASAILIMDHWSKRTATDQYKQFKIFIHSNKCMKVWIYSRNMFIQNPMADIGLWDISVWPFGVKSGISMIWNWWCKRIKKKAFKNPDSIDWYIINAVMDRRIAWSVFLRFCACRVWTWTDRISILAEGKFVFISASRRNR